MSLSLLESLPVELLYEVQLFAVSEQLPLASKRLYHVFKSSPISFNANYIFQRILPRIEQTDNSKIHTSILRYPICTPEVFQYIRKHLFHPDNPGRPELPRRLFRYLIVKEPPFKWKGREHPLPFLEFLYDSNRSGIPPPDPNSHQGYALTKAVHVKYVQLVQFLLIQGATPSQNDPRKDGLTLEIAIRQKDLRMVKMLIEPDAEAKNGKKRRKMEDRIKVTRKMLKTAVACKARDIVEYFVHEKRCVPDVDTLYMLGK